MADLDRKRRDWLNGIRGQRKRIMNYINSRRQYIKTNNVFKEYHMSWNQITGWAVMKIV